MVKKIQGYTLLERIGSGSYGEVYRASHATKFGVFAIKVIPNTSLSENPKVEECLINEVKVLSKIGFCDNIVGFYELIKTKNNHYFVYEFCNGGTLQDKLNKKGKIPELEALQYLSDILAAFKKLNKFKVLHRDLKPENILFHNDKLKLGDFGLCKDLKPDESMTKTMLGSPIYMAPQILKGEPYTSKADIWSLGVITYEIIYGFCPFQSNSIAQLTSKIDTCPVQFPSFPEVSPKAKLVMKKMLTKDHFRRISWIQLFNQFPSSPHADSHTESMTEMKSISASVGFLQRKSQSFLKAQSPPIKQYGESIFSKLANSQKKNFGKENKHNFNSVKFMKYIAESKIDFRDDKICDEIQMSKANRINQYERNWVSSFLKKLQEIHQEIVGIFPIGEKIIMSKDSSKIKDLSTLLNELRIKLSEADNIIKMKKQVYEHPELNNLETMIKYEILNVDQTLQFSKQACGQKNYYQGIWASKELYQCSAKLKSINLSYSS